MEVDQSRRFGARSCAFLRGAGLARQSRARKPGITMRAADLPLPIVLALTGGLAPVQAASDGWTVSETTSPIDYSPIATATIPSRNVVGGAAVQLAIRCRGGRT